MLLSPEQETLRDRVRNLVQNRIAPIAEEIAEADVFPSQAKQAFIEGGFFKLALDREYGGAEYGATELSLVTTEIARVSGACALIPFPTNAVIRILCLTADQEQKKRWLPLFGRGDKLAAFCLTEPDYGSDAGSLAVRAVRRGGGYLIRGTKIYVTLGQNADYYLVFARTGPGKRTAGVSAFLIEKDRPGLKWGHIEEKMGLHGSVTQEMILDNCLVPAENILLGEGLGWQVLTSAANPMRLWGAGSMALGIAQGAYELALDHARTRIASGHKISRYQSVQFMLADMKTKIEAARSLILRGAALIDSEQGSAAEVETTVSMAKYFASDTAMEVCTNAVQIFGRQGVSRGHPVERMFRDVKAIQIFDGSNQVQRMVVARHILKSQKLFMS